MKNYITTKKEKLIFEVDCSYDPTKICFNRPSGIFASDSFHNLLNDLIKKKCLVSRLIKRALVMDMYVHPKNRMNYIAFREKEGMISYLPKGKEMIRNENGSWARKNRQEVKPVKFARDLLNPRLVKRIPEKYFTAFGDNFKAYEDKKKVFLKEESFSEAYSPNNTDISSCMVGKDVSEFYNLFDTTVLVARRGFDNKMIGRAILWKNAVVENHPDITSTVVMDRIYAISKEVEVLFKNYAIDHNYTFKPRQGAGYTQFVLNGKNEIDVTNYKNVLIYVTPKSGKSLNETPLNFYPYIDTFSNADLKHEKFYCFYDYKTINFQYTNANGSYRDLGWREGYVYAVDMGWRKQEQCLEWENNWYAFDSGYCVRLANGQRTFHKNPDLVSLNDGSYYLKTDEGIGKCERSGSYYLKTELIEVPHKGTNGRILVHKRYRAYYEQKDKNAEAKKKISISYNTNNIAISDYEWYYSDLKPSANYTYLS